MSTCYVLNGSGYTTQTCQGCGARGYHEQNCGRCNATGNIGEVRIVAPAMPAMGQRVIRTSCGTCGGSGSVRVTCYRQH